MKFLNKLENKLIILQIVMILTGIIFILIGMYRGEILTVFKKAIYICLECIGIG